jgi:hypothetical protein
MNQPTHGWLDLDGMIFQEQHAKSLQKYQGMRGNNAE